MRKLPYTLQSRHFNYPLIVGLVCTGRLIVLPMTRARGYKTFFMLSSVEHEIIPAFNIYEREKQHSRLI